MPWWGVLILSVFFLVFVVRLLLAIGKLQDAFKDYGDRGRRF